MKASFYQFLLAISCLIFNSFISIGQVVGGRENGEMTPKSAEPNKLSGGSLKGDVNPMTGEMSTSVALGSVSTPGGLGYNLSLDYSSSFSLSATQAMTSGIPYGEGWGPNLPTISVEVDAFHKFNCTEMSNYAGSSPMSQDLNFGDNSDGFSGEDEGDLYWFSPIINIPGVISGRAIFKYIDVADEKCIVFALNKFETSAEIRYYGKKGWEVRIANGDTYKFGTHLASYTAPSSQRVLFYDQDGSGGTGSVAFNQNDQQAQAVINNAYGDPEAVQNVVEPKETFTAWYCDQIWNINSPRQGIMFRYNKYGAFNYFQEYEQANYDNVQSDVFFGPTNTDFTSYSDLFLKDVYSYVAETPVDIIELNYETFGAAVDNSTILNGNSPGVVPFDGLYNSTVVYEWGDGSNSFSGWNRYRHAASVNPSQNGTSTVGSSANPYIQNNSSTFQYNPVASGGNINEVAFDHGFLESERLFPSGSGYFPGDIYEIKTKITRPNGSDVNNGNGTIDIAVKTGQHGYSSGINGVPLLVVPNGDAMYTEDYDERNGVEVFSTFNSAVKWQMADGQSNIETSNLFVMPNIPSTYHGISLQVGPGNSDIDFTASPLVNLEMIDGTEIDVREAYPYTDGSRQIKSTNQIPHAFGTGHPWSMMVPAYNEMALGNLNTPGIATTSEDLYRTWWATNAEQLTRDNIPTKFDQDVKMEKVELIRYSKNALMLTDVKIYRVNGEFKGLEDATKNDWQLSSHKHLAYGLKQEPVLRNYNYGDSSSLEIEALLRKIILLEEISDVPVSGNLTELTTTLKYSKFLSSAQYPSPTYYEQAKIPFLEAMNNYLLESYTDALGGITRVKYYNAQDSVTRKEGIYKFSKCDNYSNPTVQDLSLSAQPFGKNRAYVVHPAVQYLAKNDEGDEIVNPQTPFNYVYTNPAFKVWEYVYDVNSVMWNPKKLELDNEHFRSNYFTGGEFGFKNVRVYEPYVDGNATARNYTDYEYFGKIHDTMDLTVSLEEYLYYGKVKHVKHFSYDNVLEDETLFEYGNTLAFENGYLRPNFMREHLWNESPIIQDYEYQDIQENDILEVYQYSPIFETIYDSQGNIIDIIIIDSTLLFSASGPAAYPALDIPNFSGNYTDKEQPKFLEFYFFNDLLANNHDFQLNSYFVKKTNEISRVYEDALTINGAVNPPVITVTSLPANNPFGSGHTNPIANDSEKDDPIIAMINPEDEETTQTDLLNESPLSDNVLIALLQSEVHGSLKYTILNEQGNLSNTIWSEIWNQLGGISSSDITNLAVNQTYISDAIQLNMFNVIGSRSDANMVTTVLLKNSYLSGQVITALMNPALVLPGSTFGTVISEQPQLPESTLVSIVNSSKTTSSNLSTILSNQFITHSIYSAILNKSSLSSTSLVQTIQINPNFPVDLTLLEIINHTPQFTVSELEQIFDQADRAIGSDVSDQIDQRYSVQDRIQILLNLELMNSLNQYCGGAVVTGRTFIETRTDYEYYEADHEGKAVGMAYEILLGMRENALAPSPFPYNIDETNLTINQGTTTINGLQLKHEPSWQVFAVKTSSPQMPEAYSREEYFYNYDLRNRYDRHWYYYDLDNPEIAFIVDEYTLGNYDRVLVFNDKWDPFYQQGLYGAPQVPAFDGMTRAQQAGNRVFAFQKTSITKNSRSPLPKYASEYYFYDKRWIVTDAIGNAVTNENNDPCQNPTTPPTSAPCEVYVDCNDCNTIFYKPYMDWAEIVPMGYCAWLVPEIGYIVCPESHNVALDFPNATLAYCENIPQLNQNIPISQAFKNMLQLRSVMVQIDDSDHSTSQEFSSDKLDENNAYVAEFYMGPPTALDANNFPAPHHMIVPFDNIKVREIKERNRYTQVVLEENSVGLKVKYDYNKVTHHWNVFTNCSFYNYTSNENVDIGLPTQVTVGYTLPNALTTAFEYTPVGLVSKITDPNNKMMEYAFDGFHRLKLVKENGSRLLSEFEYSSWDPLTASTFADKTKDNYVQTKTYSNSNASFYELAKAFVDPLGRNQGNALSYTEDNINHNEIHSGYVSYDNLGRVITKEKTYINATSNAGTPTLLFSQFQGSAIEEVLLEGGFKGRPERSSNFGVAVTGAHAVKNNYAITNNIYTSCELNLSLNELYKVMRQYGTANFRFFRQETFDQDDKQSVTYTNALGQNVATLRYNDSGQKIITLFVYDDYGNLTEVINPEKQKTSYIYNKLGQLVIETTVDAGSKHYMYNKQGLVSIALDEQGRTHLDSQGNPDPFYRIYQYDIFGRPTQQGRSMIDGEDHSFLYNNELYGPLHYKSGHLWTSQGNETYDPITLATIYFDYDFSDAQTQDWLYQYDYYKGPITQTNGLVAGEMDIDFREKSMNYGFQQGTNELGRVTSTYSYNENDQLIQSNAFSYDAIGNIDEHDISFNAAGTCVGCPTAINSKIYYPEYNYRGSLLQENIDVNKDGTIDFQCFMTYDPLNRLKAIHGAAGDVGTKDDATLLVSYDYNDVTGSISKKVQTVYDASETLIAIAAEIAYSYDQRDRLTNIETGQMSAGANAMLDYSLYYDDQVVAYNDGTYSTTVQYDQNWNGNINGMSAVYDFTDINSINNAVDGFDAPTVYGYKYDKINRLVRADGTVGDMIDPLNLNESYLIGNVNLGYDRIGNITFLQRTSRNVDQTQGAAYTTFQNFNYIMETGNNRLTQVYGVGTTPTRNYTYDANGNLLTDDSKNLNKTVYGRASYPYELVMDPDNNPQTLNDETVNYLYSASDLRIYKKDEVYNGTLNAYETQESYYLMDAMGRTIALYQEGFGANGWEYYVHGTEREARVIPTNAQAPGSNTTLTNEVLMQVGLNKTTFYVSDHLGNTRVTYTPEGSYYAGIVALNDNFDAASLDGWAGNESTVSNSSDVLAVEIPIDATDQYVYKQLSQPLVANQGYTFFVNVTGSDIKCQIGGVTYPLADGPNSFNFTPTSTIQNPEIRFTMHGGNGQSSIASYELDKISLTYNALYTKNRIDYVGDYFPYGKILREFVNGDRERYLTTQHERDAETGFDYRGARYYDADIARFLSLDPLAKDFASWSPYNYVMGNPISLIDPDGKYPIHPWLRTFYTFDLNYATVVTYDSNKSNKDEVLYAAASPLIARQMHDSGEGMWSGASSVPADVVPEVTTYFSKMLLADIYNTDKGQFTSACRACDSEWRGAAASGTYIFFDNYEAESTFTHSNRSTYTVYGVTDNVITDYTVLKRDPSSDYNMFKVALHVHYDISTETFTKSVSIDLGAFGKIEGEYTYDSTTVTATKTRYINGKAQTPTTETKTYNSNYR